MTDEVDNLRSEIAALRRELALRDASGGTVDPRKKALLDAGVPMDRLQDAAKVFRPSGNATTGIFTLGDMTGPVDSLAREWLSTRPWFGGGEPEAKPDADGRAYIDADNERIVYPDGSSLPLSVASSADLYAAAGEAPKSQAPPVDVSNPYANAERKAEHLPQPLSEDDDSLDALYAKAGAFPKGAA